MKIVSLKTFLVTVFLCIPFVLWNIVRRDIIWLCFSVYLLINGFRCSFSQEAYDADVKKAAEKKQKYRKIFGCFAPIAPFVPIILILLGAAIVSIFPVNDIIRVIAGILLVGAVVYAFWLMWITSGYKDDKKL